MRLDDCSAGAADGGQGSCGRRDGVFSDVEVVGGKDGCAIVEIAPEEEDVGGGQVEVVDLDGPVKVLYRG